MSKPQRVAALTLVIALPLCGELLPIKTYTALDGLAHNHINRIKVDSHGFLWFCTDAGISRFDGRRFFTLTTADGLPHPDINDLVEARDGSFWLAGDGGISRFRLLSPGSDQKPKIRTFRSREHPAERYDALEFDREGRLWAGGHEGLFQVEGEGDAVRIRWANEGLPRVPIPRLLADRRGGLWIATAHGAFYRPSSGKVVPVAPSTVYPRLERYAYPERFAESLLQDREGRVWVGYRSAGFCLLEREIEREIIGTEFCIGAGRSLFGRDIRALLESTDGRYWVGSTEGLCELERRSRQLHCYRPPHGLAEDRILRMAEDPEGNLWLGTGQSGVMRLARPGFVRFTVEDGFVPGYNVSLLATKAGQVVVSTGGNLDHVQVLKLDGNKFREEWNSAQSGRKWQYGAPWQHSALEDSRGQWWVPAASYLYRFPAGTGLANLHSTQPEEFKLPLDTWYGGPYEDSRGELWVSTIPRQNDRMRWSGRVLVRGPSGEAFREIPAIEESLTRIERSIGLGAWISCFREDGAGGMWLGISNLRLIYPANTVTLLRYYQGKVREFSMADGLPPGTINAIHADRQGRLWIGSYAGLVRLDQPSVEQPRFTKVNGLGSDEVWCVTEDDDGRIYAGTGKGVDRLDLQTGRIRHFTTEDGLPRGRVLASMRSRSGQVWFASDNAVSRFEPERLVTSPPATYLVRPAGTLRLPHDQSSFEAEFSSPSFSGAPPRFQYRLTGVDADWRPATGESVVRYAGMSPGAYELQARAVNAVGVVSPQPAILRFEVMSPFWRTWWFLALLLSAVAGMAYLLHQYQLRRLLAMERLRVRIASDLHDEIGSSLAQVSMLGELARRSLNGSHPGAAELIERMAGTCRDAVASMSDIVWSIHPRNDGLSDLVSRMRQFALDVLSARDIEFDFEAPAEGDASLALPLDVRRDLLLIFKESVNNAARHAGCRRVRAVLICEEREVRLTVEDDGHGFDPLAKAAGQGLGTLRARARKLAGRCDILSAPGGGGARILVSLPLKERV